jgi:hypothetical protein
VRQTSQTETLIIVDNNDPIILYEKFIDQRLKGTLGITG